MERKKVEENIKDIAKDRGVSIFKLAQAIGKDPDYMYSYLRRKKDVIDWELLIAIAGALNCQPSDIIWGLNKGPEDFGENLFTKWFNHISDRFSLTKNKNGLDVYEVNVSDNIIKRTEFERQRGEKLISLYGLPAANLEMQGAMKVEELIQELIDKNKADNR